ncbi:MAG: hypothetical protein QGI60_04175 [archaeon]|jgi:hypothetical protein|nr:hypothetical protein [archaeon]
MRGRGPGNAKRVKRGNRTGPAAANRGKGKTAGNRRGKGGGRGKKGGR